jgi:hypothetical protein
MDEGRLVRGFGEGLKKCRPDWDITRPELRAWVGTG